MKQNGAAWPVSRGVGRQPLVLGQGGPDEQDTSNGGAAPPRIHHRVYTTDRSTLRRLGAGRHLDHGTAHDQATGCARYAPRPRDIPLPIPASCLGDVGRDVHGSWVPRDDVPRDAGVSGPGNDARREREDGVACRAMRVRIILRGRVAVRPASRETNACRLPRWAWKNRSDVFRRHDRRAAVALGELGFCNTPTSRYLCKTIPPYPGRAVIRPRPRDLGPGKRAKAELRGPLRKRPQSPFHAEPLQPWIARLHNQLESRKL